MEDLTSANTGTGTKAILITGLIDFIQPLTWFIIAALIIILADLRFGIAAAKKRGDEVRFSRAGRRTINKLVDYITWILVAGALGEAFGNPFGIPLLPALTLLVVYGFEINSCYHNYFESKGKKVNVDFFSIFRNRVDTIEIHEPGKKRRSVKIQSSSSSDSYL